MPKAAELTYIDDKPAKKCSKCDEIKPLYEFHNSLIGSYGKRPDCKDCVNKINRKGYSNNKNNVLERSRERRLSKFGLNQEEYLKLYNAQEGKCLICNIKFDILSVDHDHYSNKIRGLLCMHCNFGIGHFKNSTILLINAINYLKKSNE